MATNSMPFLSKCAITVAASATERKSRSNLATMTSALVFLASARSRRRRVESRGFSAADGKVFTDLAEVWFFQLAVVRDTLALRFESPGRCRPVRRWRLGGSQGRLSWHPCHRVYTMSQIRIFALRLTRCGGNRPLGIGWHLARGDRIGGSGWSGKACRESTVALAAEVIVPARAMIEAGFAAVYNAWRERSHSHSRAD